MADTSTEYINSTKYTILVDKINNLHDISFDLTSKILASRMLRYAEIDIEVERKAGRIAPDELYVPQHVIDTNIRREQSSYIQYITQSPRAVILKDKQEASFDLSLLEVDLTEKLRWDGWQLPAYANIDGFQSNGYGICETIYDKTKPGNIAREYVQFGDFCFIADTRDLQKVEMLSRAYYFTRTKLDELTKTGKDTEKWNSAQVKKILDSEPNDEQSNIYTGTTTINRSLYKVMKIMFRVKGIVQVGWACPKICDDWLRAPRPLFLGRRAINNEANKVAKFVGKVPSKVLKTLNPSTTDNHIEQIKSGLPPSDPVFETQYPYFLYPYLISENDNIANLKGRVFLDQDTQNAASSLLSSLLTKTRRSAGLYFSKDTTDPNDDFLMQKNINFKTGALINGKIKEFKLDAPDASLFTALQTLVSANQQETSQINFAETNRQNDSRKTATAIKASMQQQQQLSGTQVTLFSIATKAQYTYECEIIKSRVLAGLIKVNPVVFPLYQREWTVKPSGDVDVIEKQQKIQMMQQTWPVYQNTPAAQAFLTDLTELMFPDNAPKYLKAFADAQQQKQSQQGQMLQQGLQLAKQLGDEIVTLSKKPEMFSETGRVHAFPIVEKYAQQYQQIAQQLQQGQQPQQQQ
jgi:hypothetical protein